jgi:tetratricopeptide (TPR) repeat protein
MEPAASPFDVFLSHNGRDKPTVREICKILQDRGLRPWLDEEELLPGGDWQEEIEKALLAIPVSAVLVGEEGLGAWERPEMRVCLNLAMHRKMRVIPVLLPGAPAKPEIPPFLGTRTWIDFRSGLSPREIDRFLYGITGRKPTEATEEAPGLSPPPLHNLPFESLGDLFKGRDVEMAELEAFATSPVQKKVLHGLGGIGKTRLAVEHAWRHGARYRAAFFVRADTPAGLRAQVAALAGPALLRLPERQAAAEEEVFGAVLTWLRENPGWLLILDNVDTEVAARAVRDLLPRLQGGKVLVTSRLAVWPPGLGRREVEQISPEEAARFLLERTQGQRAATAGDPADATRLAGLLDGLPLALEQAGAYIAFHRISLSGYLDAWERTRGEVLAWYDDRVMDYPRSLAVTWQQTVERLGPGAAALLRLAAYLAPEPIPVALFESGEEIVAEAILQLAEETGQPPKEEPGRAALADLAAYSMINQEDGAVVVHRLVQEVTRTRIPAERRRAWIELSLQIVDRFAPFDADDVRTWPVWDLLRPHAAEVLAHADTVSIPEPTGRLMNQLGLLLNAKGLFAEAEGLYRRSLEIGQASLGKDHPKVAVRLSNLAQLLQATNRLAEAEPLIRHALDIDRAAFGNEHPRIALDLNNLAGFLLTTNRLAEAEPLMRRALDIDQAAFGNEHPRVAVQLNNLAQLLKATSRLAEAEPLMRRALDIDQTAFGNEHPNVARDLNNLAGLLQATNRLDEAEPLMRRSLDIFERSFGQDHPSTETVRKNLEILLAQKGGDGAP